MRLLRERIKSQAGVNDCWLATRKTPVGVCCCQQNSLMKSGQLRYNTL